MSRTDQGFPRPKRLTRPAQFRRVFADPTYRSNDRYLKIVAAPNGLEHARLGLAISRRVSPRAVVRNRIKRLIRESFRHQQTELEPVDIVVVGHSGLRELSTARLNDILERHWKRLSEQSGSTS